MVNKEMIVDRLAQRVIDIKKNNRRSTHRIIYDLVQEHPEDARWFKDPTLFWILIEKCDELMKQEEQARIDARHNQALQYMGG